MAEQIPLENVVLSCFYQQGPSTGVEETADGPVYKECWKGKYSEAKNLLNSVAYGSTLTQFHTALGVNRVYYYAAPSCPTRNGIAGTWKIKNIRIDEITAGTLAMVYVDFYADYATTGELTEDPESNVWNLDWIAYQVSPYNFLKNAYHTDNEVIDDTTVLTVDWSSYGKRSHIEEYLNATAENKNNQYCYRPMYTDTPNDYMRQLNGAEQEVMKKASLQRNATYHYPQVTHTTAKLGALSAQQNYPDVLGGALDTINYSTLISGCPFTFSQYQGKAYVWIKTGDSMMQTKNKKLKQQRWERKETWIGVTDADVNFYGTEAFSHDEAGIKTGRWPIEGL